MKKGFTLAEVLITLVIIGVVAAMTMPTLIQNHQKQVWVNQFKKAVSTISQGVQFMLAEEGVEEIAYLPGFDKIPSNHPYSTTEFEEIQNLFNKTFKITEIFAPQPENGYPYKTLSEAPGVGLPDAAIDSMDRILMADGTIWAINFDYFEDTTRVDDLGWCVAVDVNGDKGPNKQGRDIFEFYVNHQGKIFYSDYDDNCVSTINNPLNHTAAACASKIVKDGWKMNY